MTRDSAGQILQQRYSIGWDVGAWNCDRGDSRDALVVLMNSPGEEAWVAGKPWRGNLRSVLDTFAGLDLLLKMLRACEVEPRPPFQATVAIDTPLGWPQPMIELVIHGKPASVPQSADENPYLFRRTELDLFAKEHRPLSAVRDMIGSQSTKGIHFLKKSGLVRASVGVWRESYDAGTVTAIEMYPAPCRKSASLCELFGKLVTAPAIAKMLSKGPNVRSDVEDALRCAAVAWLHADRPESLVQPGSGIPVEEGWIWLPADSLEGKAAGHDEGNQQ